MQRHLCSMACWLPCALLRVDEAEGDPDASVCWNSGGEEEDAPACSCSWAGEADREQQLRLSVRSCSGEVSRACARDDSVPMSSSLEEGSDSKDSQRKNMETHEDMSSSFPQPPVENMETCPQVSSLTSQSTTGESANGDMGTPLVAREDDPTDEEVINSATDQTFWDDPVQPMERIEAIEAMADHDNCIDVKAEDVQ